MVPLPFARATLRIGAPMTVAAGKRAMSSTSKKGLNWKMF